MRDIGKSIKDLRIAKSLTQDQLAEKLFVTRQTVSNYENGKSRPDIETIEKIASALDCEITDIIYNKKQPAKNYIPFIISFSLSLLLIALSRDAMKSCALCTPVSCSLVGDVSLPDSMKISGLCRATKQRTKKRESCAHFFFFSAKLLASSIKSRIVYGTP